jgi:hypothetical protein
VQLFFGSVALSDVNGAKFTWGRQLVRNAAGIGVGLLWRVQVERAVTRVNGQIDADARITAAQAALALQDQDLIFYRDDAAASAKSVLSAGSLSGVRCVEGPVWSSRPGAQHVTWLEFAATFEWETRFASAVGLLTDFHESLTIEGGTPKLVVLEPINAPPVLQETVPVQGYRAVQEGEAVGVAARPTPAVVSPYLWPANLTRDVTVQISASRVGQNYKDFGVRWVREYVSATPLVGVPNEWID